MVFDDLRRSFDDFLARSPADRRGDLARMRSTLVQAKVGLSEMLHALDTAQRRLAAEQSELATVRRRKSLAAGINDHETVAIAERYEQQHGDRVRVLEEKVRVQRDELALAESEVQSMTAELKSAAVGIPPAGGRGADIAGTKATEEVESITGDGDRAEVAAEIDSLSRARAREFREVEASRMLDELKRRMGK